MGDPVLVTLGLGVTSNAIYGSISHQLRRRLNDRERSLSAQLSTLIKRQLGYAPSARIVGQVIFREEVWVALVATDATRDRWGTLLHDLIPPEPSVDVEQLANVLKEGIRLFSEPELRLTLESFSLLRAVRDEGEELIVRAGMLMDGQEEIQMSQAQIVESLAAIREAIEQLAPSPTGEEPQEFSRSIRDHMAAVHRQVTVLTEDQFRTIEQLRGRRRVVVSGSAGSGKTLLACEKAVRLSRAGLRTLILCHNPLLADNVARMVTGSGVAVSAFGDWVNDLSAGPEVPLRSTWTNLEEPTDEELLSGLGSIIQAEAPYDAIIVDEGQDFRSDWWALVDAALVEGGILYVFVDDAQAILPDRAYPSLDHALNLSRNCRNSGAVYRVMSVLAPSLPKAEVPLERLGMATLLTYERGSEGEALGVALGSLGTIGDDEAVVVLTAGTVSCQTVEEQAHGGYVERTFKWQDVVRETLLGIPELFDPVGVSCPPTTQIDMSLRQLSTEPYPTSDDVAAVQRVAHQFAIDDGVRRKIVSDKLFRDAMRFTVRGDVLCLGRRARWAPIWSSEIVLHFQRSDWPVGIPSPARVQVSRSGLSDDLSSLPLYEVAEFKGLEADTVIVLWDSGGMAPLAELFVAVSRARVRCVAMLSTQSIRHLPPRARRLLDGA